MKLVYVAGKYRGTTAWEVELNVRRAEEVGLAVSKLGAAALIPHSMNRFFEGALPDAFWLASTMVMLERCDALVLVPGWENSDGAKEELARAKELGKWVFETVGELKKWLDVVVVPVKQEARADRVVAVLAVRGRAFDHLKLSPEASSALRKLEGQTEVLDARSSYRCVFCDVRAVKRSWGPGRIWCPSCGQRQPSPGELDDANVVCFRCEKTWRDCSCGEKGLLIDESVFSDSQTSQ